MSSVCVRIEYERDLYFPGDVVKGHAILFLTKAKEIKSVTLKARGNSQVEWSEKDGDDRKSYKDTEEYYKYDFLLFKSASLWQLFEVGSHKFEFAFSLPAIAPCSFESSDGYVRHYCKVTIDIYNKVFDVKARLPFSVGGFLDLNNEATAKEQILRNKEKTLCCLCCKRGDLAFTLNIDHSGYVPGEHVVINAECTNRSKNRTKETRVSLHQEIIYIAKKSQKKVRKEKCSKSHPGIASGDDDIWSGENFLVPPLPPSGLPMCSIIDIKYTLHFSFIPSGMSLRLEVKVPIIIGTIPLKQVFANLTGSLELPRIPIYSPSVPASWNGVQNVESLNSLGASASHVLQEDKSSVLKPVSTPSYEWFSAYPDLPPMYKDSGAEGIVIGCSDSDNENESLIERDFLAIQFRPCYVTYGWKN